MGMADSYYSIDPAGDADIQYRGRELYCADCDAETYIEDVSEEYSHGVISWWASWTCSNCGAEHTDDSGEYEYDPTDGME